MATTSIDLLAPIHRLSVNEYRRMHEAGLLDDVRVELIDGVVVEMSPLGRRHERGVIWLTRVLVPQLSEQQVVSPQNSIVLRELRSMPQPDIAIRDTDEVLGETEARPLLVIEVADSSLRFDRITKGRLYARAGIADYWIVDVADEAVEVHREPGADGQWGDREVFAAGATLRPLLLPEVTLELEPLMRFVAGRPEQ